MPELPEVEAVARTLRPLVQSRRIRCVHVFHPIATKPQTASHVARHAQGQRILIVDRKGKYLLLILGHGLLTMHFRLDGQLLWFANGKELLKRANQNKSNVHVDVALELDKGVLGFADRRHFGRVDFCESVEDCSGLSVLGIDALSRDFTSGQLAQLLAASKRPLKDFFWTNRTSPALATSTPVSLCGTPASIRAAAPTLCNRRKLAACTKQLCPFSRVP